MSAKPRRVAMWALVAAGIGIGIALARAAAPTASAVRLGYWAGQRHPAHDAEKPGEVLCSPAAT